MTALGSTSGLADSDELERVVAEDDDNGRIHAKLKDLTERYGALVATRFPDIPRRVSGYNLDELLPERGFHVARALVGSESTCALVTEATVTLAKSPSHRRLVVLGFADVYLAADSVPHLLRHPLLGLEGFDEVLVRQMRAAGLNTKELDLLQPGAGWLLVEVGGDDPTSADEQGRCTSRRPPRGHDGDPVRARRGATRRVACARLGARRGGASAGRGAPSRGMGGCCGRAGQARDVPAGHPQSLVRVRLLRSLVRSLRPGLCAHSQRLRLLERRGLETLPLLCRARGGSLREPRWLPLRRARRRPGPRRATGEDVRRGAGRSVP